MYYKNLTFQNINKSLQSFFKMKNKVKIGLEIHGYLNTKEKLFCQCKAIHGAKLARPNTYICPICTGQPGAKPMLPNSEAIKKIIQIALILNCKINKKLTWQRKHYDWPDLPKGYQNTISGTYAIPIGLKGKFQNIKIKEAHLEEDPAAWNPETGEIDYNRSGTPLVEIVTEPDFKTSEQVVHWLKHLLLALSYIKAIDKKAGIKADVNISTTGERVEVKNVNSLKSIKKVIDYEIERQSKEKQKRKETRAFDSDTEKTILMRIKEEAEDYRFISDPDLPVIKLEKVFINIIEKSLPEKPEEKLKKLIKKYKIDKKSAEVLIKNLDIVEFFEKVIEKGKIPLKLAIPWTTIELLRILNYNKKYIDDKDVDIKAEHFIELLKLVQEKKITELKAKQILNDFIPKSSSPKGKLKEHKIISSETEIEKIAKTVIEKNEKAVQDYKSGKKQSLNFLIGQIMRLSNRRADYKTAREILEKLLKHS